MVERPTAGPLPTTSAHHPLPPLEEPLISRYTLEVQTTPCAYRPQVSSFPLRYGFKLAAKYITNEPSFSEGQSVFPL